MGVQFAEIFYIAGIARIQKELRAYNTSLHSKYSSTHLNERFIEE